MIYYVALPFTATEGGSNAGAVAFSRSGDPNLGDFEDAVILKTFGQVPDDFAASQSA
jgi:hypothetical protein